MADGSLKPCSECNSTGSYECPDCEGAGEVECECDCGHVHERECDTCDGEGAFDPCPTCKGGGSVPKTDADLEDEGQLNLLTEGEVHA